MRKMEDKEKEKSSGLMRSPLFIYQAFMKCLLCAASMHGLGYAKINKRDMPGRKIQAARGG